jgi:DNA-binding transcriptional LysR family regulator
LAKIELRHLRYFVAVAEEGHFGRAAERLGMAQPPLSQQIQGLERQIGEVLLERRPRVRLTAAGVHFLEAARRALTAADAAVLAARRAGRGEIGALTVGFPASALPAVVPPVVRRFRELYPDVELVLRELSTAEQIVALEDGGIDVGFLREAPAEAATLICDGVFTERYVAVLPADHRLSDVDAIGLRDLGEEPFVLFPPRVAPGLHQQVQALCRGAGFAPRTVQEAQEWLTIVGLVDAGMGISLVPASFRRLKWGEVQYRDLTDESAVTSLWVCRSPTPSSSAAANFVRVAAEVLPMRPIR